MDSKNFRKNLGKPKTPEYFAKLAKAYQTDPAYKDIDDEHKEATDEAKKILRGELLPSELPQVDSKSDLDKDA